MPECPHPIIKTILLQDDAHLQSGHVGWNPSTFSLLGHNDGVAGEIFSCHGSIFKSFQYCFFSCLLCGSLGHMPTASLLLPHLHSPLGPTHRVPPLLLPTFADWVHPHTSSPCSSFPSNSESAGQGGDDELLLLVAPIESKSGRIRASKWLWAARLMRCLYVFLAGYCSRISQAEQLAGRPNFRSSEAGLVDFKDKSNKKFKKRVVANQLCGFTFFGLLVNRLDTCCCMHL